MTQDTEPPATSSGKDLEVYADLVSLYPENETYLRRYADLLIQAGQITTATEILRRLHALLLKSNNPRKAEALAREFPQIGRIVSFKEDGDEKTLVDILSEDMVGKLWLKMNQKRIREGHHLFHKGEHGDTLYLVIKGELAACVPTGDGKVVLLNMVGEGDIVGEGSFLNPGPRNADVVANRDSIVVELPRNKTIAYLAEHPDLEKELNIKAQFRYMTGLLSINPLLQCLPLDMRQYMAKEAKTEHYASGTVIHKAGEELTAVDMLVQGKACYQMHAKSDSQILYWLPVGELVGDTSAVRKSTCPAMLVAKTDVLMAHVPYAAFKNVVEAYPPLRESLFRHAHKQRERIMLEVSKLASSQPQ